MDLPAVVVSPACQDPALADRSVVTRDPELSGEETIPEDRTPPRPNEAP